MQCYVYKGEKQQDYFVYLEKKIDSASSDIDLPEAILGLMGELEFVIEFELTSDRKLAQAEAKQVLADIQAQGFYLQMPKKDMRAVEDRLFS